MSTSTTNAAKGTVNGDMISFTIAANDQITDAEKFNDVIIAYRNGAPIRVRDVGNAVSGPEDVNIAAMSGGRPSVILLVFKQPGANVIETVDRIKADLPRLTAKLPPDIQVGVILDRTITIRSSVHDVEFTLALTFGLVISGVDVLTRTRARVLGAFETLAGVVIGGLLVLREMTRPRPLVPLDLLRDRMFALSVATSIASFTAQMLPPGQSASGFFYFQTGLQRDATIYLSGIREAATGKELLYFELPLK